MTKHNSTPGVNAAPETPEQLRQITDARKRLENVPEHLRALLPAAGAPETSATADDPAFVDWEGRPYDERGEPLFTEPAAGVQPAHAPRKRWPFVESPGEFTRRLCSARDHFGGDMLAAVRHVLIEEPATIDGVTASDGSKPE